VPKERTMTDIFKMIEVPKIEDGDREEIYLGIHMRIAGQEIPCPVSKACHSYDDFAVEVAAIQDKLQRLLKEAKAFFEGPSPRERPEFSPEMSAQEIWSILSEIEAEDIFVKKFNDLDDVGRREVAEYALTRCNVFSGKASVVSARYNQESGLIE
jgi:hypothetical protein